MDVLLVHAIWLWGCLLGRPGKDVGDAEAARAGAHAAQRFPALVEQLGSGFARVLLALDVGASWRRELDKGHTERDPDKASWPDPAWKPYRAAAAALPGVVQVEPPEYPAGALLPLGGGAVSLAGKRGSGRDVCATVARAWRGTGRLVIASGRSSMAALVEDARGIALLRDLREEGSGWTWMIEREADTTERLGHSPWLVADVRALESLSEIGEVTARKLVAAYGSALVAVEAAQREERLPGITAPRLMALRAAGADGGAGILRALALVGMRDDVPGVAEMVAAWSRGEVVGDGDARGRDEHAHGGPVGDGRTFDADPGELHGGDALHRRERDPGASEGSDPVGSAQFAPVVGPHREPIRQVGGAGPLVTPYVCANCARGRCGGPLGDLCEDAIRCKCNHARYEPATTLAEPARRDAGKGQDATATGGPAPPPTRTSPSPSTVRHDAGEGAADGLHGREPTEPRGAAKETRMSDAMVHQGTERSQIATPAEWTPDHMRIVREAFAPTATQAEFEVMYAAAKARGLDPVKRQIFFIKRRDKRDDQWVDVWASQVSIDGFRSIAQASGAYDGQDEPEYEYDAEGRLVLARVRVWKKGISRPFVGVARWQEYVQTTKGGDPTHMWKKMEHTMLGKCAEALALRRAFPERLSGLYTREEMEQEDNPAPPVQIRVEQKAALALPPAPIVTAQAMLDRIRRAAEPMEIHRIVAEARQWPKVRGHAWLRLLVLADSAERVDEARTLFDVDELPEDILAKLERAASDRTAELSQGAAA